MERILGLLDAENVPVAIVHYTGPAIVILWFLFSSSFHAGAGAGTEPTSESSANGSATVSGSSTSVVRPPPRQQSLPATKLLFVIAVLTFVTCSFVRYG